MLSSKVLKGTLKAWNSAAGGNAPGIGFRKISDPERVEVHAPAKCATQIAIVLILRSLRFDPFRVPYLSNLIRGRRETLAHGY
jgi:hypothetical protein